MSLPLSEWISGALIRSESARSSSAAPLAAGSAYDQYLLRRLDPAGDGVDLGLGRGELGRRLQRRDAAKVAVGLGADDIDRKREMGDPASCISGGDGLVENRGRLRRRRDGLRIERDVAKQEVGVGRLHVIDALQLARHVAGQGQDRRMIAARLVEAGDQVSAPRPRRAGADAEPAGQLGLAGGGERRAFLVANADPFNAAAADGVADGIE